MMDVFSWKPVGTAVLDSGFRYVDTPFENGSFQRRYKGRKPKEWSLKFKARTTDIQEIRTFFETHNSTDSWMFLWYDPWTGDAVTVCFADPSSLSWSLYAPGIEEVEIKLKEVI